MRIQGYALVSMKLAFWVTWLRRVFRSRKTEENQGLCSIIRSSVKSKQVFPRAFKSDPHKLEMKPAARWPSGHLTALGIGKAATFASQYSTEDTHGHTMGLLFLCFVTVLACEFKAMHSFHQTLDFWSRDRDWFLFEVENRGCSKSLLGSFLEV